MPILGGLKSVGGAVKNSIKKFVRRTPSSGSGKNSAPSSRNSTRSNRSANAINRKTSVNKTNLSGRSGSAPTRGLSYSPYGNSSTTTSNPYQRPSSPPGTNFSINTRGTSALSKGLGGAAITKAGVAYTKAFAKYGPLGLAALLFADIVLADRGLSDGTLPEHLRQPGERQLIEETEIPDYTGVPGVRYTFHYRSKKQPSADWTYGRVTPLEFVHAPYTNLRWHFTDDNFGYEREDFPTLKASGSPISNRGGAFSLKGTGSDRNDSSLKYNFVINKFAGVDARREGIIEFLRMEALDGSEDYERKTIVRSESGSTTDNSKAKIEEDPNTFPSSIRPPFPSNETAKDNFEPSRSLEKPSDRPPVVKKATTKTPKGKVEPDRYDGANQNNNSSSTGTQQPKLEAPTEIPEPIPEPEPPEEKTLDEEQIDATSTEEPKILEQTVVKRADGTTTKITRREATEEELDRIKKIISQSNRKTRVIKGGQIDPNNTNKIQRFSNSEPDNNFDEGQIDIEREPSGKIDRKRNRPPSVTEDIDTESPPERQPESPPEPDREPPEPIPEPPVKETKVSDDPISDKIDNLPSLEEITVAVAGLDIIQQIAKKAGSASPVCLAPALVPPVSAKVTANNKAILGFQALNTTQNVGIQATVNVVNRTTNTIATGVTKVQNTLGSMQQFAKTAWRVTRADKIMNGVATVMTIHNGMMLSNNLLSTVSEAANMSLNALGIRDETDTVIDIGAAVRGKITAILQSLVGAENYEALTARIAKTNRIYQTGINLLDTTYSLFDSARTVNELTAEHTGKIGNALREAGVVYEDAYEEFSEKVNPQNIAMRKLGSFRDTIEVAEDAFNTVSEISSAVVETRENIEQIRQEKEALKTELGEFVTEQVAEKDTAKTQAQVTTDISENDFDRDTAEN